MKTLLTIILFFSATKITFAQQVQYSYDNHGNRIQRKAVSGLPNRLINPNAGGIKFTMSSENNGFNFSPNPSTDRIVFTINDYTFSVKSSIAILDQTGKEIKSLNVTSNKTEMDVSNLPDGMYIVKFEKNDATLFYKMVKVK